jgi:lysophospholipase L1-like esterase
MTIRPLVCVVAALAALGAVSSASPSVRNNGLPASIAALGDSITTAACADGASCANDTEVDSWATGTDPAVDSHLHRLQAMWKNRGSVRAVNLASNSFVTMADLPTQALQARRAGAAYVTIEIGENDLCAGTPIATFQSELARGLAVLTGGARAKTFPPKILLLSIENLADHWRVLQADPAARKALDRGYGLDCGLGGRVTRLQLAQVEARARALNHVEAEVCSTVPYCLYDGGTYYDLRLRARYFSPADYQHLSRAGQHALAAAEWKVALKILYD